MKVSSSLLKSLSKEKYLAYIRSLPNFHDDKVQSYLTVILTFIAICFFGIFAISPTLGTIVELRKSLADSKFLDDQLQTKITSMTQLQSAYTSLSPQLPLLYTAIPQSASVGTLTGQIRSLAENSHVTLSQLQIKSAEIASGVKEKSVLHPITFTIGVTGSFQSFQSFYESLINFDRLVTINSLSVSVPSELDTNEYRMTIEAQAYYRP